MSSPTPPITRYFGFLIGALVAIGAAGIGCSVYERITYRAYRLGIGGELLFTPYYLGRLALITLLVLLLIGGLYRLRDPESRIRHHTLSRAKRRAVYAMIATAAGCVALLVVNRALFRRLALEDGLVEWASALIPLAASGAFLYAFCRIVRAPSDARRSVALGLAALFGIFLFVIGMEEISWMQRVFGFATPEMFSANEQGETNLHNMHNSLYFNVAYRTAVFGGLIVLPLIVETAPANRLFEWIGDFLPRRFVLAVSAPLVGFEYNQWNFFLGPFLLVLAVTILACYAVAARRRGDRSETILFAVLAMFAVAVQFVFMARGPSVGSATWLIAEYRELFLALGLAVFTWEVTARLLARYSPARGSYQAFPA